MSSKKLLQADESTPISPRAISNSDLHRFLVNNDVGENAPSTLAVPPVSSRKSTPIEDDGLSFPSLKARIHLAESSAERALRIEKMTGAVRTILECIGEDPNRDGLLNTPERYAKALMYLTKGYEENVEVVLNKAIFEEDHDEMVVVRDIDVFSMCEHHMVPFTGKIHIGYIPNKKVVGLSKIARIAEMFARRLQVQERMTRQIALTLQEVLQPQGVAVVMEASHLCMVMRGVQKPGSSTVTSSMLGVFQSDQKTREEFLTLIKR